MATLIELLVVLGWTTFWLFVSSSGMGVQYKWYRAQEHKIWGSPPGWLFGVVWPILYALLTATSSIYMLRGEGEPIYLVSFILLVINGVLNYTWYPTFFEMRRFKVALGLIVGMFGTALTLVILWGIHSQYLPMALVLPYVVWLLYAGFLNAQWTRINLRSKKSRNARSLPGGVEQAR